MLDEIVGLNALKFTIFFVITKPRDAYTYIFFISSNFGHVNSGLGTIKKSKVARNENKKRLTYLGFLITKIL